MDAEQYRKVIASFATGVTVVTTNVDGRLHGFTANAVSSLSLEPILLLVCVDKRARALEELRKASSFGVSVLAREQENISNVFAMRGEPEEGALRDVPFSLGSTGVPLLNGSVAQLECRTSEHLEGGDHIIVLGEVIEGAIVSDAPPLLYYRGKYRGIEP
jgi:flavin reductase (DIM6/NTAB) family NADH-FMN oxidoreductase RutF